MNRRLLRFFICLLCLGPQAAFFGCGLRQNQGRTQNREGYRVVSYDAQTHQWTLLRTGTFNGERVTKRLVAVCSSYRWGSHAPLYGPEECHLVVGRLIVPNPLPKDPTDFVDVDEMVTEDLDITERSGEEQTSQMFKILKNEVVTDPCGAPTREMP